MAEESVKKVSVGEDIKQEVGTNQESVVVPGKEGEKLSEAEVSAILDSIFTKGFYEEEIELPRKHRCVFCTRTSGQAIEISERLEAGDPGKMTRVRYNQLYSLYCLSMSLVSFDGEALPEKLEEKVGVVSNWAGPLTDLLLDKLTEFDKKVADAYTADQVKNS